jgi:hypothetical protein
MPSRSVAAWFPPCDFCMHAPILNSPGPRGLGTNLAREAMLDSGDFALRPIEKIPLAPPYAKLPVRAVNL